ncbi:MAG: type IV secretion system DNA-binding domain-containing protein [Candidatus Moranbacteria bacterium]|nr:type IV secretion system DNA-binding domain-containing protein [Candidatus Moranbacteria bacterium]MDD3965033.1 type IV secretion system DNA-binding domain-containing protein [Candidatus Moranbacteria bacterium]
MATHDQNDITFFAKTNFRNQERIFGIKTDDRRRHMYVIGKTGMGKTNLLENLAIQDIQKGHGIAFIDPHGDTAEKLIKAIPSNRINDVIYLNPSDQDFPIAFNVMEKVDPEYRHLVASGLVGVFKKIWADSWGPRLEYILRNAILALLEYPGSTLLGVTRILVDKSYRAKVVEKITDPVVRSFWVDEFSQWNDRVLQEVISPIQNKVGQFLSSSLIRNIVGQTVSSFNIREVMDQRKILIINLSKGRIGEDNGALLGAMMITKIQLAAMGRVDIPEEDRKDFYLYVDEFQNFATESFANILSEARKYHLNLVLANQYVTQIEETVRDAIFGNAGSIVSFRVGAMDAEFLEKEFEPVFMMNDIINLPKFQIYLKLMIDGIAGDAFSATTLPPIKLEDAGNEIKIIQNSRERYSSSREDVEEKIRRWSGMLTAEERQAIADEQRNTAHILQKKNVSKTPPIVANDQIERRTVPDRRGIHEQPSDINTSVQSPRPLISAKKTTTQKEVTSLEKQSVFEPALAPKRIIDVSLESLRDTMTQTRITEEKSSVSMPEKEISSVTETLPTEKKLYPTQCVTCGTDITVPFIPDGKRPTFCRECLRDYQRSVAKERNTIAKKNADQPITRPAPAIPQRRNTDLKSYVSSEAPLSLAQIEYMGSKKFQSLGNRPAVNLNDVRALIKDMKKGDE